jgi:hypothetical protein
LLSFLIRAQVVGDSVLLDCLRQEIRPLKSATRRIQPRGTTSTDPEDNSYGQKSGPKIASSTPN